MFSLAIPNSGLLLESSQSSAKPDFAHTDMFSLTLADSVIEDMIKCVRNGKAIQLSLGKDPKILYGSRTQRLTSTHDPFTCQYFRTTLLPDSPPATATSTSQSFRTDDMPRQPQPLRQMSFWGQASGTRFISQIRTVKAGGDDTVRAADTAAEPVSNANIRDTSPNPIAGADDALAALKSSLASEDARKRDNTTKYVRDGSSLPPAVQKKGSAQPIKAGNKARFLSQHNNSLASGTTRSMPTSPALTAAGSPSLAPTSVPLSQQQAEKAKAIRKPIIHTLALGPATEEALSRSKGPDTTEQEFKLALEKVADLKDGKWRLKEKPFRELDVFSYKKYTPEDRQLAIDNAVRVYDKLRLNASEPEWDRLLPVEERGTGKSLSKLQAKIATGSIQPVKAPKIKVQGAEESGRDITAEDDDEVDLFGEEISTATAKGGESMTRSYSNPPATKPKKVSEKEARTKRLLAKPGKALKSTAAKTSEKKSPEKDSSKFKSSKFVIDSDEEDKYVVPSTSAATAPNTTTTTAKTNAARAPTVKSTNKRPRDDHEVSRKPKPKLMNTSPQKSSPLASSPPTNASDFDDSSSSSLTKGLKRKATDSSSDIPASKRHQKSSSNSTNSSVTSSSGVWSDEWYRERREKQENAGLQKKFELYYETYVHLHNELLSSPFGARDKEKIADLQDMHGRLEKMKVHIAAARKD